MNNVNATIVGAIAGDGGNGNGSSVNNNSVNEVDITNTINNI